MTAKTKEEFVANHMVINSITKCEERLKRINNELTSMGNRCFEFNEGIDPELRKLKRLKKAAYELIRETEEAVLNLKKVFREILSEKLEVILKICECLE